MQVNEYENGSVGMSQPNHLQVLFDLCGYGDDHVGAEIPMPVDWNEADQDDSPKIDIEAYMKLMGSVLCVCSEDAPGCSSRFEQGVKQDTQVH